MKNWTTILKIELDASLLTNYQDREVYTVSVAEQQLGYISTLNVNGEITVTPFTAAGELPEVHCDVCAAKALFAKHYSIPSHAFERANPESRSNISEQKMKGLLTALALASLSRR